MPLDEAYFVWLYDQVGSVKMRNRSKTYWELLRLLHRKKFTWSKAFEKDANRAQDGKDLRNEFLRTTNPEMNDPGWMQMECSILEMLIALSWRLAFEGDGEPRDWFWLMIDNLGLTKCTDANPPEESITDIILDRVLFREYEPNGIGGLFPLKNPETNQREVELWYQAQAYLLERI